MTLHYIEVVWSCLSTSGMCVVGQLSSVAWSTWQGEGLYCYLIKPTALSAGFEWVGVAAVWS